LKKENKVTWNPRYRSNYIDTRNLPKQNYEGQYKIKTKWLHVAAYIQSANPGFCVTRHKPKFIYFNDEFILFYDNQKTSSRSESSS